MPLNNYEVTISKKALKQLKKLDTVSQHRITEFLQSLRYIDPKSQGKKLQGNMDDIWRYRVGNYRILAHVEGEKLTILIVKIGHRKDVYK
jgi:mRNA interferase RelE/StbE